MEWKYYFTIFRGNVGIGVWDFEDKLHVSGGYIQIDYPHGL